jgi:hypothetical protein
VRSELGRQLDRQPPIVIMLSIIIGFIAVVSFFALSEGIKLFIDLEHN